MTLQEYGLGDMLPLKDGGGWVLVGLLVFKISVGHMSRVGSIPMHPRHFIFKSMENANESYRHRL